MKTIFKTGPGWFSANTSKPGSEVPEGKLHVCCASIELYELDEGDDDEMNIGFDLLVSKAEDDPRVAKALLALHDSLGGNIDELKRMAKA